MRNSWHLQGRLDLGFSRLMQGGRIRILRSDADDSQQCGWDRQPEKGRSAIMPHRKSSRQTRSPSQALLALATLHKFGYVVARLCLGLCLDGRFKRSCRLPLH